MERYFVSALGVQRCEEGRDYKSYTLFVKAADVEALEKLYSELLYQVSRKHPNESRHQTALRYLKQAESNNGMGQDAVIKRAAAEPPKEG